LSSAARYSEVHAWLKAEVAAARILDRSPVFYGVLIPCIYAGYLLSLLAIVILEDYAFLTAACLCFSFFTVQTAGLMHDSGHRAVFRSGYLNSLLGYASSSLIGMTFPSWQRRHNAHHLHPNQQDLDPDMDVPFIAVTRELFEQKDRLQRAVGRWQAFYYYPLGSLVAFTNRLGSLTYFARNRSARSVLPFCLYVSALFVLFVAPFLVFPLEKAVFVLLLVNLTSGVYLANCFAPNHKGMAVLSPDAQWPFLRQQVETARNVSGGPITDFLLVGLNYQVEHHLFPSCPRNKLPRLKSLVQHACRELDLPYTEVSFLETNRMILRQLRTATGRNSGR
jgi:fatty acid desaturase